jgi:hypothetical protein
MKTTIKNPQILFSAVTCCRPACVSNSAAGGSKLLPRNIVTDATIQVTAAGSSGDKMPAISVDGRRVTFGYAGFTDTRTATGGLSVQDRTCP